MCAADLSPALGSKPERFGILAGAPVHELGGDGDDVGGQPGLPGPSEQGPEDDLSFSLSGAGWVGDISLPETPHDVVSEQCTPTQVRLPPRG